MALKRERSMEVEGDLKSVTVRRSRGKWTVEQRERMVRESAQPSASVSEVAQRHGVRANLLSMWRRQAGVAAPVKQRVSTAVRFAPIQVQRPSAAEGVIEIDVSGGCVRVRGIVDGAMLREAVATLR